MTRSIFLTAALVAMAAPGLTHAQEVVLDDWCPDDVRATTTVGNPPQGEDCPPGHWIITTIEHVECFPGLPDPQDPLAGTTCDCNVVHSVTYKVCLEILPDFDDVSVQELDVCPQ